MAQAIADQLATCKKENGNTQTRIAACTWIIDKAKDDEDIRAEAHLQRGVLYELAGDKEAAIKDYSEAIALDASNALAYFNRGNVHDQLGQHDRAIADYTQPSSSTPPTRMSSTIAARSTTPRATTSWRSPTIPNRYASSADNPRAFFNRGSAYDQLGTTIAPLPTTPRRSSSTPAMPRCSSAAARPTTTRAITIWRLPTTRSRSDSAATTRAPTSIAPWPCQQGRAPARAGRFQ